MQLRTVYLIFSVIALVRGFSRYYYEKGYSEAELACAERQASTAQNQLNQFVKASQQLAADAYVVSQAVSAQMTAITVINQESTREIRYELKNRADARCQYSADIMQQLDNARQRANQAATSGFGGSLSASGTAGK
ncbi:hypothetical protein [Limnobaculum xujianqingii]|uniref:hypothetical protein n=1 Tax=Limnobaculum xujianqingii TaxID=2738837 RepID=UPI00112E8C53|nr:hypothetical protein [Limnobaculum xujianqingii]